uniref:Uncharacterized protein n=1 Tax=Amphimedon queenslandica TaxID=400682 RepID=A0A1X7STW2_AMPQE
MLGTRPLYTHLSSKSTLTLSFLFLILFAVIVQYLNSHCP